jgi:HPt (histidine-containing phosphotransfer) domain-containing protein
MRRLLENFIEHHQDDVRTLTMHIDREEWAKGRLIAHSLKGSSGQIGARHLESRARPVEDILLQGIKPAEIDIQQMDTALSDVLASAVTWLEGNPLPVAGRNENTQGDTAALHARLHHLMALLEAFDGQALTESESLADALQKNLPPHLVDAFGKIVTTARAFNLESASRQLRDILPELEEAMT